MITKSHLTKFGLPLLAASTFVLPIAAPSAAALVEIGDHASLFFNGSATVRANDNIFLAADNEESDIIFIFSPGLELDIGARGNAGVNIYYREDFYRYNDNSMLDNNYSNVFLTSHWNQPRLNLGFNASYEQLAQATPDLHALLPDQLVERDLIRVGLRGEYDIGDRTSVAGGVNGSFTDFDSPLFADRDVYTIPVNFYYELTPLVDLSLGYRYRNTDLDSREDTNGNVVQTPDYRDHFFNVGVRGELAPKLIGEGRIGYQERTTRGPGSDQSGLSFGLDLSHFTTARTTLTGGVFRDFATGGLGDGITVMGGSLGARHTFSHLISAQAGVTYTESDWDTGPTLNREDERWDFNVGATYSPNVYLDISAGYIFRTNSSNIAPYEYDNNIFSLSAALRY